MSLIERLLGCTPSSQGEDTQKGGGLATAGGAGDEDEAALLGDEGLEGVLWETELLKGGNGVTTQQLC